MSNAESTMGSVAVLPVDFTVRQYGHFWVKYMVRPERNDVVYQFFSEDPEVVGQIVDGTLKRDFKPFHEKFAKALMEVFQARVIQDRFDPAYLDEYNSYSVLLRGYADSSTLKELLEPLFEEINRRIA
jgi:hypothetical protein